MFPMASFLAPVDTALICSRVKKVLEGHGLEFQVMFVELATYSITERKYFSGPGFESQVMFVELATYIVLIRENILVVLGMNPSDSYVSYGILPCTC